MVVTKAQLANLIERKDVLKFAEGREFRDGNHMKAFTEALEKYSIAQDKLNTRGMDRKDRNEQESISENNKDIWKFCLLQTTEKVKETPRRFELVSCKECGSLLDKSNVDSVRTHLDFHDALEKRNVGELKI
jgi:hypothetical protein